MGHILLQNFASASAIWLRDDLHIVFSIGFLDLLTGLWRVCSFGGGFLSGAWCIVVLKDGGFSNAFFPLF